MQAPKFQWSPERIEKMKALRAAGHTCAEIAITIGATSRGAVSSKMHALGMSERGFVYRPTVKRLGRGKSEATIRAEIERAKAKQKAKTAAADASEEISAMRRAQSAATIRNLPDWASAPIPGTKPIKLIDLNSKSCRWPLDTKKGVRYCGCTVERHGLSYCPSHQAVHTGPSSRTPEQLRIVADLMTAPGNPNSQP